MEFPAAASAPMPACDNRKRNTKCTERNRATEARFRHTTDPHNLHFLLFSLSLSFFFCFSFLLFSSLALQAPSLFALPAFILIQLRCFLLELTHPRRLPWGTHRGKCFKNKLAKEEA